MGTHNCHTQATCTNTVGSFTCACKDGYSGNGVTCDGLFYFCYWFFFSLIYKRFFINSYFSWIIIDIDECALGTHGCSTNSICANTIGSYICTCKPGYEGTEDPCNGFFFLSH